MIQTTEKPMLLQVITFQLNRPMELPRDICVIHGIPFYKSSGNSSAYAKTWLPFLGIDDYWLQKPEYRLERFPEYLQEKMEEVRRYFTGLEQDRASGFYERFGNYETLLISASLGGGFWETQEGLGLIDFIKTKEQGLEDYQKVDAYIKTIDMSASIKVVSSAGEVNQFLVEQGSRVKEVKDFDYSQLKPFASPSRINIDINASESQQSQSFNVSNTNANQDVLHEGREMITPLSGVKNRRKIRRNNPEKEKEKTINILKLIVELMSGSQINVEEIGYHNQKHGVTFPGFKLINEKNKISQDGFLVFASFIGLEEHEYTVEKDQGNISFCFMPDAKGSEFFSKKLYQKIDELIDLSVEKEKLSEILNFIENKKDFIGDEAFLMLTKKIESKSREDSNIQKQEIASISTIKLEFFSNKLLQKTQELSASEPVGEFFLIEDDKQGSTFSGSKK